MRSRIMTVFGLSLLVTFILLAPNIYAQKMTYTVQKGDTLWDICEKYYGDSDLWPKLWQMNPFITNPHLLKPGDVITLFERAELERPPKPIQAEKEQPVQVNNGIDLAMLTDLNPKGYLSSKPIESYGKLFAANEGKMVLFTGDTAYLVIKQPDIKKGDEFIVGRAFGPLKDPVSGKKKWYLFSVHGRISVEGQTGLEFDSRNELVDKKDTYQAKILSSFKAMSVDDIIVPPESLANCIKPASFQEPILANIVAAEGRRTLIGKHDIVYINQGRDQSIQRGNLFEIVKTNYAKNPSPDSSQFFRKNFMVLPDIPIGYCLVIDTRSDTSTAVVLSIREPFVLGTYIKSRAWNDHPELLSGIQTCTLD